MDEPNSLPLEDSSTPMFFSSSSSSSNDDSNSTMLPAVDGWVDEGFQPQWHMFCLLVLVAAGVVGNSLVCVAVCVEKKLQNVTNYFLVSLAIADLLVSLVVMPCCIVQEFVGNCAHLLFIFSVHFIICKSRCQKEVKMSIACFPSCLSKFSAIFNARIFLAFENFALKFSEK